MQSEIKSLIKEYRVLQKKHGRSFFPGDPYRLKLTTLKKRIERATETISQIEDAEVVTDQKDEVVVNTENDNDNDFISISEKLSQPSIPVNNLINDSNKDDNSTSDQYENESNPNEDDHEDFGDGAEIDDSFEEFENEEPKNNFLPVSELADIIVNLHDHLPLISSKLYAKLVIGDKSKIGEARLIDKKVKDSVLNKTDLILTSEERELYEAFCQVEDYKEDAKPNDQTKLLLKRAWEIKLREWGYDNMDIDKNSMVFAYGLLAVQMGLPFIPHISKFKNLRKSKK